MTGATLTKKVARAAVNLSFAGCGFLGVYQVGVAEAFRQHSQIVEVSKAGGSSAGALVAAAMLTGLPMQSVLAQFEEMMAEASKHRLGAFSPYFHLGSAIEASLHFLLPPDSHLTLSGRLHVSLTNLSSRPFTNSIVSQFPTRDHLISSLLCSCYLPLISGPNPPSLQGERFLDGGFTQQFPTSLIPAVRVSPFSGYEKEICPRDQPGPGVTLSGENMHFSRANVRRGCDAFRCLSLHQVNGYYNQGRMDGKDYIEKKLLDKNETN